MSESQVAPSEVGYYNLAPEEVVRLCLEHHCPGIAYTYTEPLTYIEYVTETARLAHEKGLWNILVTAGYVCQEPLADLLPYLDAANVDLKSFSDEIYQRISGGHLAPVLDTILAMKEAGVWIELTTGRCVSGWWLMVWAMHLSISAGSSHAIRCRTCLPHPFPP